MEHFLGETEQDRVLFGDVSGSEPVPTDDLLVTEKIELFEQRVLLITPVHSPDLPLLILNGPLVVLPDVDMVHPLHLAHEQDVELVRLFPLQADSVPLEEELYL